MITNTWKHAAVGSVIMLFFCIVNWLINNVPNTVFNLQWMGFIAIVFYSIRWEIVQEGESSMQTYDYLKLKWLDIICDLIAGISGAAIVFLLWNWIA